MEFHHLVCHAKSHHRPPHTQRTAHSTIQWGSQEYAWQWKKCVENKAKSIRQVFTIGYVVFKYSKQKQTREGKIENSVCVLRHQPPIRKPRRYGACVKIVVYFYLFPYGGKHPPHDFHAYGSLSLSIIWIISFRFKCVCVWFPSVKIKRSKCACVLMCVVWFCACVCVPFLQCFCLCNFISLFFSSFINVWGGMCVYECNFLLLLLWNVSSKSLIL